LETCNAWAHLVANDGRILVSKKFADSKRKNEQKKEDLRRKEK